MANDEVQSNKNKRLFINIFAQIIVLIVNFCISFFLTPIIVNKIGKEAYGYVGLSTDFINYATIVTAALNTMASRFIAVSYHQNKHDEVNKYFSSVFFANIIISIFLSIISSIVVIFLEKIIEIPNNMIIDVKLLFIFMFANFLISIIGSVFSSSTFTTNNLHLQSKRKIESNIIKSIILIISYCFFKPYILYIGIATIISTIYSVIMDIYYTKKLLTNVRIKTKFFDIKKIKQLLISGVWSSINKLSGVLSNGLDLLISNKLVGTIAMGSFSIAKTLPNMFLTAFSLIASVFSPDLTEYYAKNNMDGMKKEVLKSITLLGLFSSILVAFLFAYSKEFFELWVPGQRSDLLYNLTILSSFAMMFGLSLEGIWNVFIATNKVKISSLFLVITSILTLIIEYILLTTFKFNSDIKLYIIAGVSTVFSLFRNLIFLPIYGAKCIKQKNTTFYPIIIRISIVTLLVYVFSLLIKQIIIINSWLILILNVIMTIAIALILDYIIILDKDMKKNLKIKFIKMLKRS